MLSHSARPRTRRTSIALCALAAIGTSALPAQAGVLHPNTPLTGLVSKLNQYMALGLPTPSNKNTGGNGNSTQSSIRRDGDSVVFLTSAGDLKAFGRARIGPPDTHDDICIKWLFLPAGGSRVGKQDIADGRLVCPIRTNPVAGSARGNPPNVDLYGPVATDRGFVFGARSTARPDQPDPNKPPLARLPDIGLTKRINPVHIQEKDGAGNVVREYDVDRLPNAAHVYYYDERTGDQELVSVNTRNEPATAFQSSGAPLMSPAQANSGISTSGPDFDASGDGRFVVFTSEAENLALDASGKPILDSAGQPLLITGRAGSSHIYMRDRLRGTTQLVDFNWQGSVGPPVGFRSGGTASQPTVSDDGQWVAFIANFGGFTQEAGDNNIASLYLRHCPLTAGTPDCGAQHARTYLISKTLDEEPVGATAPSISGDGRRIAYLSSANGLVSLLIPMSNTGVFLAECDMGGAAHNCGSVTHRLITHKYPTVANDFRIPAHGQATEVEISADGGTITYAGLFDNVVTRNGDPQLGWHSHLYQWRGRSSGGRISYTQTVPVDRLTPVLDDQWQDGLGGTRSEFPFGPYIPDKGSERPSVSWDGRFVSWESDGEFSYSHVRPGGYYVDVWRRDTRGYTTYVPSPAEDPSWGDRPRRAVQPARPRPGDGGAVQPRPRGLR